MPKKKAPEQARGESNPTPAAGWIEANFNAVQLWPDWMKEEDPLPPFPRLALPRNRNFEHFTETDTMPKEIKTTYPHPVHAMGSVVQDRKGDLVFGDHFIGGWENPLCEELEQGVEYDMHIAFVRRAK